MCVYIYICMNHTMYGFICIWIHEFIYMWIWIYIYVYFSQILFHYRLLQQSEYSSLCYTLGPSSSPISLIVVCIKGFPGGSDGKECSCNAEDPGSIPRSREVTWRREWLPTPVFLPGEFHEQRSPVSYSPGGHKKSDTTEQLTLSLSYIFIHIFFSICCTHETNTTL